MNDEGSKNASKAGDDTETDASPMAKDQQQLDGNKSDDKHISEQENDPETDISTTQPQDAEDKEERPPPPPRPSLLKVAERPSLQAKATTAISSVDIQTLAFPDGTRGTFSTPASRSVSGATTASGTTTPSRRVSRNGSEIDDLDAASIMSFAPTLKANGDLASLLDEGLNMQTPAWKSLSQQADTVNPFEMPDALLANFENEFDEVEPVDSKGGNEGTYSHHASQIVLILHRGRPVQMEIQTQALPHPLLRWQAHLQPSWRPEPHQRLHRHHPNNHFLLSGL